MSQARNLQEFKDGFAYEMDQVYRVRGASLGQGFVEYERYLEYVWMYFLAHGITDPMVVEIGLGAFNAQRDFYRNILGADHIGIDINGCIQPSPDIAGSSADPEIFQKLKEILDGRPFDLLFIDGDHGYQGVKTDYEMYSPLSMHLVGLHDVLVRGLGGMCEVDVLWDELHVQNKQDTLISFHHTNDTPCLIPKTLGIGLIIKEPTRVWGPEYARDT